MAQQRTGLECSLLVGLSNKVIRAELMEILFLHGIGPCGRLRCYQLLTSRYGIISQQILIQDLDCLLSGTNFTSQRRFRVSDKL